MGILYHSQRIFVVLFLLPVLAGHFSSRLSAQGRTPPDKSSVATLSRLENELHEKATKLQTSAGMRRSYQTLLESHKLPPNSINYSDFVLIRLLFEATRDAGFWDLHWEITDRPPNSDRIWRQWHEIRRPAFLAPTAIAECDELSALFAFLVRRVGVKSVGLFWPYPNHTVAVWTVVPTGGSAIRVVVRTTQIFLTEADEFDTRRFDPWHQKTIYEYSRSDVPDSFALPPPLFDFFLEQIDKYAGASDATLQDLRYLRDAVFLRSWTPEQAARSALKKQEMLTSLSAEDVAAYEHFARDMRGDLPAF
jgi:hypothetical protein